MGKKICHQCKKEYNAKTKRSQFCCHKCANINWRERNGKYNKDWRDKNREKYNKSARITNKKFRKEHPEKAKEWNKKNRIKLIKDHPERIKAYRKGYKKRDKECLMCKKRDNLEFHHLDYEKEIGITLCRDCHKKLHTNVRRSI